MASGPAVLPTTRENTNYARLCRLLVDVGCHALRDTFDRIHPPPTLHRILSSARPKLQSLRDEKILNPTQWGKLYPAISSSLSSKNFDITLVMVLLRNICNLTPPISTRTWYKLPRRGDNTREANIARINYYRNEVYAHAIQASVNDKKFDVLWKDISKPLLALGSGTNYAGAINRLKTECMDPEFEEHFKKLLIMWKKDEDSIKKILEELEDGVKEVKKGNLELKDEVKEVKKEVKEVKKGNLELKEWMTSNFGEVKGDSGKKEMRGQLDLNISGSEIRDEGAVSMAKAIETDCLKTMDMSRNEIGDKGAAALADALKNNSTITELDVSRNKIGDRGATALAEAIKTNSTLTKLYVSHNEIGDSGAIALAKAIETNLTLTKLDLSVNKISPSGAAEMTKAMKTNSTLTNLDLSDNKYPESGASAMAKAQ